MTTDEAVERLDQISGDDPDSAHSEADKVLLDLLASIAPEVSDAYERVIERCRWWASA